MPHPTWRQRLRSPALQLGLFCMEMATPGLPLIVKHAGCDFLVLDMEHSGFSFETAKALCVGGRAANLPIVIRVAHRHPNEVSRALDVGADALMAPLVSTVAEAAEFIRWATYPPDGSRGVAMMVAHDGYLAGDTTTKLAMADAARGIIIQIETREGAANADGIAALRGVDCLWIGHMDLSCSLGIPGQFEHPEFRAAEAAVMAAAHRHGKALGRLAASTTEAVMLAARGYTALGLCSDVVALQSRLAEGVAALRQPSA